MTHLHCCGELTKPVKGSQSMLECGKCGSRWTLLRANRPKASDESKEKKETSS